MKSSVDKDEKSYRSGVILGLSLAEVILLTLFCLLLLLFAQSKRFKETVRFSKDHPDLFPAIEACLPDLRKAYPENISSEEFSTHFTKDFRAFTKDKGSQINKTAQRLYPSVKSEEEKEKLLEKDLAHLQQLMSQSGGNMDQTMEDVAAGRKLRAERSNGGKRKNDGWPPFMNLSESKGFYFEAGSSQLTQVFGEKLQTDITDRLTQIIDEYGTDVVEVIGHTDEQPIYGMKSNLDQTLIPVIQSHLGGNEMIASDNNGLGMARAVSVAKLLIESGKFKDVKILPLSAGQMIEPVDKLASGTNKGDSAERRRIEIRVRRSSDVIEKQDQTP